MTNISNLLNDISKQDHYYLGNVKRTKSLNALAHHHFVIPDCDESGNLLTTFVFVQFIGLKLESGFNHFLICKLCNEMSESLQQVLMRGNVSNEFLQSHKQKYCVHSRCISKMDPEESYNLNDNLFPWYFGNDLVYIKMIQSKPPLIAVLASGQYGLVSLPTRAKNTDVFGHIKTQECVVMFKCMKMEK